MTLLALACFKQPEIQVSSDAASLASNVPVPPDWTEVRWAGRPLGSVGLGPTDTVLVAIFPGADTSALSRLGDRDVLVDPVLAGKLGLPETLSGERFEPEVLDAAHWDTNFIIEGDYGVVVTWYSR